MDWGSLLTLRSQFSGKVTLTKLVDASFPLMLWTHLRVLSKHQHSGAPVAANLGVTAG